MADRHATRTRAPSITDRIDEAARRFADADMLRCLADGTVLSDRLLWRKGEQPRGSRFEYLVRSFETYGRELSKCTGATRLRRLRRFDLAQATRIYELHWSIDRSSERMASVTLRELLVRLREGNHLLNITLPKTPGAVLANAIGRLAASGRFDRMHLRVDGRPATRDQLVHYQLLRIASVTAATDWSDAARLAADVLDESAKDHPHNAARPDWYWPNGAKFSLESTADVRAQQSLSKRARGAK
jgi:hypothetical protein